MENGLLFDAIARFAWATSLTPGALSEYGLSVGTKVFQQEADGGWYVDIVVTHVSGQRAFFVIKSRERPSWLPALQPA